MKLNIIAFTVLILGGSCASVDKKKNVRASSIPSQQENSIKDTALYMRVGNPDTALAIFVFEECYNYDYDLQREEYMRWDLGYDKLQLLVDTLFRKRNDYSKRIRQIRDNKERFLSDARNVVNSDADEYNVISDTMEFQYLVNRRDLVLKDLISHMLKDPKVEKEEKEKLEAALSKL